MTEPASVLIDTSKEGLSGECDFLVRIPLHIDIVSFYYTGARP
jgi:hypothetical protein